MRLVTKSDLPAPCEHLEVITITAIYVGTKWKYKGKFTIIRNDGHYDVWYLGRTGNREHQFSNLIGLTPWDTNGTHTINCCCYMACVMRDSISDEDEFLARLSGDWSMLKGILPDTMVADRD